MTTNDAHKESEVLLEVGEHGIARLTLNRPANLNALTDAMVTGSLPDALRAVAADASVTCLVVTGAGRGFCAGADLSTATLFEKGGTEARLRAVNRTVQLLHDLEVPTIAAVNGAAAGAGVGLALACDIRLGSPTAKFVTAFFDLGIVPDFGVSWFLARTVGTEAALRMIYSSAPVPAEEAKKLGLIGEIHEDVVGAADRLAGRIAGAPLAARLTKANVRRAATAPLAEVLFDAEPVAQGRLVGGEEFNRIFPQWAAKFR